MTRPVARDGIVELAGYHSPQLDVEVRLNTNESPIGPPEGFAAALAEATRKIDWNRYPDRTYRALREAVAEFNRRDATIGAPGDSGPATVEHIFAANGSNEVLQTLMLAYGGATRAVGVFEPTYAMYGQIARATGTAVTVAERDKNFRVSPAAVADLIERADPHLVIFCSPNNPTGTGETHETIELALERCRGLVVVDEAYGQFAQASAWKLASTQGGAERLVVVRTYSKTWALAGLRLGYCLAPPHVIAELAKVVLPYHLDAHTQLAGRLALDHVAEMNRRVAAVVDERERLAAAVGELGLKVWPSQANFVLIDTTAAKLSGDVVWQALVDRSVLVRNCSSWPRLANCLRVTVGKPEENQRFIEALGEVLGTLRP